MGVRGVEKLTRGHRVRGIRWIGCTGTLEAQPPMVGSTVPQGSASTLVNKPHGTGPSRRPTENETRGARPGTSPTFLVRRPALPSWPPSDRTSRFTSCLPCQAMIRRRVFLQRCAPVPLVHGEKTAQLSARQLPDFPNPSRPSCQLLMVGVLEENLNQYFSSYLD